MHRKIISPLFFSLCVSLPSGCFTSHKEENQVEIEAEEPSSSQSLDESQEIDEAIAKQGSDSKGDKQPEIGAETDEINEAIKNGIPVEFNDKVHKWIDYFANKNPEAFQRFMDRGQPYKKLIVETLRDRGIPTELYYLAMIESGFVLHAKSHASAVGFWQFIGATGRRYGLRVDKFVDERRDPRRASIAASMYLSDLNNVFDSWYLALAAYNAGETRIMNAIMRGKSRNFWDLAKSRVLPEETMDYIPKFMAAFIIGSNPEKYGFRQPKADDVDELVAVSVPSPLTLSSISELTQISVSQLKNYNPHLTRSMTPPGPGSYKIWVPSEAKQIISQKQDQLAAARLQISAKTSITSTGPRKYHRVLRGENLASIAEKYNTTISQLKTTNNLRGNSVRAGIKLKIIASENQASTGTVLDQFDASAQSNSNADEEAIYKVRRGDNLKAIARRFNVSVRTLRRINKLERTGDLRIGQVLRIARTS